MVTMIAAIGQNFALGKDNELLWHLPNDFKRFKKITSHHDIIMGRKTFESFPKPLPNRRHLVITRQKDYQKEGAVVVHSLEEALEQVPREEDCFIIGGGEIYALALEKADRLELTWVNGTFEADAFFPRFNKQNWRITKQKFHPADDKHAYSFYYTSYIKI